MYSNNKLRGRRWRHWGKGVWTGAGGGEGIIYLLRHCHHQNDLRIKVGSDESHFNDS